MFCYMHLCQGDLPREFTRSDSSGKFYSTIPEHDLVRAHRNQSRSIWQNFKHFWQLNNALWQKFIVVSGQILKDLHYHLVTLLRINCTWQLKLQENLKISFFQVREEDYGKFYSGDCYIVLYAYNNGGKDCYLIYYWLVIFFLLKFDFKWFPAK